MRRRIGVPAALGIFAATLALGRGLLAADPTASVPPQPAGQAKPPISQTVSLDGPAWLIALDPGDKGRDEKWFEAVRPEAQPATVPCTIQEVFGACAGVAWYWREFAAPEPLPGGRFLLRFWKVDYKADVWVNGKPVGVHEDGDEPFTLDATGAIKTSGANLLAVRVLHPTGKPIDGITQRQTACGIKWGPPGTDWNFGGILDSVELRVVPPVYIEDLHLIPDWKSGDIRAQVGVRNAGPDKARVRLGVSAAPAAAGGVADETAGEHDAPPGESRLVASLRVPQHRLWELDDPALYRVTARVQDARGGGIDERSDRCGFRDFRCENGSFRLNGRRLFLRGAHIVWTTPVLIHSARDRELLRKDVLYAKAMGFNMIRYLPYAGPRCQLELADELGIMVMQMPMAGWSGDQNLPYIGDERFERSFLGIVRRDRNHPSVTLWGFLNEVHAVESFHKAVALLPKVRDADDDRVCVLNSGRQHDGQKQIGSLANPGSRAWDPASPWDWHCYVPVPHDARTIHMLRTSGGFLSEYGIGAALDLPRLVRQFEQRGAAGAMDAAYYRAKLDPFMADWGRWDLAGIFGRPEDYFRAAQVLGASHRTLGFNAIRSNPKLAGFSMTGLFDHVGCGEGPITMFRDLKPGHVDAMRDGWAPLRWCLFAEPYHVYRGGTVRVEAVLANEDVLRPGDYDVEVAVFDPDQKPAFRKTVKLTVPDPKTDPLFALPVLAEDIKVEGPAGRYRLAARFIAGAAPAGEPVEFFVSDPAAMPPVKADVALWGNDEGLEAWLKSNGIASHPLAEGTSRKREVIVIAGKGGASLPDLARHIARGSAAILLSPVPWPRWPLAGAKLAALDPIAPGLYHRDDWARRHPIFDGLPCGGFMDWTFYRNSVPPNGTAYRLPKPPDEAVSGGINTVCPYHSGIYVGVFRLGEGRFIANALTIRGNLGRDPVAERLLRNMLNYAAQGVDKSMADLPANFQEQLKAMGYE